MTVVETPVAIKVIKPEDEADKEDTIMEIALQ